jgi:alkaline phosphatase/alkaline phosphatase D
MNYMKFMHGARGKAGPASPATEEDKRLGYRVIRRDDRSEARLLRRHGDIVYYDNILHGPAQSVPKLRECWHEQFRFPAPDRVLRPDAGLLVEGRSLIFASTKSDNENEHPPAAPNGDRAVSRTASHPAGGRSRCPTYRTHRVNRDLQIWLTEGRDHRSANTSPDGPRKSLWGREQREWLQRTLKESNATWKILISPRRWSGPTISPRTTITPTSAVSDTKETRSSLG